MLPSSTGAGVSDFKIGDRVRLKGDARVAVSFGVSKSPRVEWIEAFND